MRENIQHKCEQCNGSGYKLYGNTSTWHHGMISGAAMTYDICDICWGSGDIKNPWEDLRRLKAERMAYGIAIRRLEERLENNDSRIR